VADALNDDDPMVRPRAAFALGLLQAPDGVEPLLDLVRDEDVAVRGRVADALGLVGDPRSEGALLGLMDDPETTVVASACYAVPGYRSATFAVDRLIELTRREEPEVLLACTWTLSDLARVGDKIDRQTRRRARGRMIELTRSPHAELRRLAATGLSIPGREEEAASVGPLVEDPAYLVRIAAINALSFPGAPLEPFLAKVYDDEDERVYLALIDALGRMRGPEILESLARIVVHDDRLWARERAVLAVGRASNLSAQMANGLSRADEVEIRRAAAELLVGRIDDETIEFAERLAADTDPQVRAAIVPAFAETDGALSETLEASIGDESSVVRIAVARAAGRRLGDRETTDGSDAVRVLERLWDGALEPLDVGVALEVMLAAGQAPPGTEAKALLERGLESPDPRVRRAAASQLERVYDDLRAEAAGPASDFPLEDYAKILSWAQRPRAAIVTVKRPGFAPGRFTIQLDTAATPLTAWNFAQLAEENFFDDLPVYRVIPDAALYTGDPTGTGDGGPGHAIRDELRPTRFLPSTLGMASRAADRAGSTWFVTLTMQPQMHTRFTAFGRVMQNFGGVVARMLPHDRIVSIKMYEGDGTEPLPPQ
jgi:cyclophilin family peptidyl-prolyl cis-trans isomerase/HEAT repeat protein